MASVSDRVSRYLKQLACCLVEPLDVFRVSSHGQIETLHPLGGDKVDHAGPRVWRARGHDNDTTVVDPLDLKPEPGCRVDRISTVCSA